MKVLVVDDDQRIRDALEIGLQLQWQDAQVLTAADGETGLDAFFNEEPDIVLLDVTMPLQSPGADGTYQGCPATGGAAGAHPGIA